MLAKAHANNRQHRQAREMFLRAGACLVTRHQAEWIANALLELAAFEREEGELQTGTMLVGLAEGIKRASSNVQRAKRKPSQQNDATDEPRPGLYLPEDD